MDSLRFSYEASHGINYYNHFAGIFPACRVVHGVVGAFGMYFHRNGSYALVPSEWQLRLVTIVEAVMPHAFRIGSYAFR